MYLVNNFNYLKPFTTHFPALSRHPRCSPVASLNPNWHLIRNFSSHLIRTSFLKSIKIGNDWIWLPKWRQKVTNFGSFDFSPISVTLRAGWLFPFMWWKCWTGENDRIAVTTKLDYIKFEISGSNSPRKNPARHTIYNIKHIKWTSAFWLAVFICRASDTQSPNQQQKKKKRKKTGASGWIPTVACFTGAMDIKIDLVE